MTIDPEIVAQAKRNAAALFKPHAPASLPSPRPSRSVSPLCHRPSRVLDPYRYHTRYDGRLLLSPCTDTEVDYYPIPEPRGRHPYPAALTARRIPTSRPSTAPAPPPALTPLHSPGWTVVNPLPHPSLHPVYHYRTASQLHEELHGLNASANPWLSAIPRSPTPGANNNSHNSNWHPYHPRSHHHHHDHQHPHHHHPHPLPPSLPERGLTLAPIRLKRRFDQLEYNSTDADAPYDAGSSHAGSLSASPISVAVDLDDEGQQPTTITTRSSIRVPTSPRPTTTITFTPGSAGRATAAAGFTNEADTETDINTARMMLRRGRAASERDAAIMLMHMRGGQDSEEAEDVPVQRSRDGSASAAGGGASSVDAPASAGGAAEASITGASPSPKAAGGGAGSDAVDTPSGPVSPAVSGKEGRSEEGGHETRSKRRKTVEGR